MCVRTRAKVNTSVCHASGSRGSGREARENAVCSSHRLARGRAGAALGHLDDRLGALVAALLRCVNVDCLMRAQELMRHAAAFFIVGAEDVPRRHQHAARQPKKAQARPATHHVVRERLAGVERARRKPQLAVARVKVLAAKLQREGRVALCWRGVRGAH